MVDEESRIIAASGNVLETEANLRRATDDEALLAILAKLSDRKGPVADALARAARDVAGGAGIAVGSRAYIDALRAALEDAGGNVGRIGEGGPRLEPTVTEPGAEGKPQELVPGVAPVTAKRRSRSRPQGRCAAAMRPPAASSTRTAARSSTSSPRSARLTRIGR
jgi:hypothetical protein